jgi:hypothetical protein
MEHTICSKYLCLLILLLAAWVPSVICAEKLNTYNNDEFRFSFQYPSSWVNGQASASNLRAKVAAPTNTPAAECAVVIKRYPKAASAKQSDIDQVFIASPTPAELEEVLSHAESAVTVSKASAGILHSRPAHRARVQYKTGETAYASGLVIMTATPGLTWTLSCSGLGDTPAEAENNFRFWEESINHLVSSFTFK